MNLSGFQYEYVAGSAGRTLLLLHGTGGDESDLLPLGRGLDETAALLSPRGRVLENGAPRFFRRLAEGVFDEEDVIARAEELARFIEAAAQEHGREMHSVTAVGYSNGANIASAMMLLGLAKFAGALLFRPMVPLSNSPEANLGGERVLLCAGKFDPIATADQVKTLAELLRDRGADVGVVTQESGHELTRADIEAGRDWLASAVIAGQE